ncbi:MAG TPA: TauD/TfdA family dioxygenase [Stellaceae bacterium]|nr:TauD/TfdA family dioxygenase [Stellaceae bacterium]
MTARSSLPRFNSIRVNPVAGALGAEVDGVDLGGALGAETVAELRRALLDHLVLFFRDQYLTPDALLAAARQFGTPIEYPFVKGIEGHPEVIEVAKLERERVNFGGIWHSDTTYLAAPPMGTLLVAREVPPAGGDTLFANMYLACETLSDGMRGMLEGLTAINSSAKADAARTREDRLRSAPKDGASRVLEAEHPVLRTHPETGRRALYVNVAHTVRFVDMTEAESAPLLDYLFRHLTKPEFTCRFRWRPGSLAFWDNRAAQHNPINDYHGCRRIMHRVTLAGERPR